MSVRNAVVGDLPTIKAIYDEQVVSGIATFDTTAPPIDYWEEKLSSAHHVLVAVDGSTVLGYAYSSVFRPRAAYDTTREVSVYLDAGARGRGVGRGLYDELLARLRADGVHTALAVVALPNPASEGLHRACGFERVGVLPEVGHKLGRWVDTAFYALVLGDG
ncbi:GNAT family N-acetyltransferase [Nocardioides sp.]|uniref:GNAT family N-acetyltransferase n=1 Tax=Nocardioides sp. TaxID=35761 RepID=UPI0027270647|nr:GNAT family N-acetyltransferase [Nocardioides sp.]MDO9455742.1 N-acetyltransferase family protein [Nocardioides sp.]